MNTDNSSPDKKSNNELIPDNKETKDIKQTLILDSNQEIKKEEEIISSRNKIKTKTKIFYSDYGYIPIKVEDYENNEELVAFEDKKRNMSGSLSVSENN